MAALLLVIRAPGCIPEDSQRIQNVGGKTQAKKKFFYYPTTRASFQFKIQNYEIKKRQKINGG